MRAFIHDTHSFYYAGNSLEDLSVFYGVLSGYKISGRRFTLDRPTGMVDHEGQEVYENDILQVTYKLTAKEIRDGYVKNIQGTVIYHDGCFLVQNKEHDYEDFLSSEIGKRYSFKIVGHGHNKQTV